MTATGVSYSSASLSSAAASRRIFKITVKNRPALSCLRKPIKDFSSAVENDSKSASFGRRGMLSVTAIPFFLNLHESLLGLRANAAEDYFLVKEEVKKVLSKGKAAGVLRLVFHDAGTFEIEENAGGMNGSIVFELDRPENTGLKKPLKASSLLSWTPSPYPMYICYGSPQAYSFIYPYLRSMDTYTGYGHDATQICRHVISLKIRTRTLRGHAECKMYCITEILGKAKAEVDMIQPVSWADVIAVAGAEAVSVCGGPNIPVQLGRIDSMVPDLEGKLPQESLDASSLKQCFQRKGFSTQELVALSGAHTLGSKGFGNPTVFDNSYFKILLEKPWSSSAGMSSMVGLPTDRALVEDDECLRWISMYANDQDLFFQDFRNVYIKLVNTGATWKPSS